MAVPDVVRTPELGFDFGDQLAREHRELRELIEKISHTLSLLISGGHSSDRPSPVTVVDLLEDFRSKLQLHFAREMKGGYLSEALAVAPRLRRKAARLYEQHAPLAKLASEIPQRARTAGSSDREWRAVARRFSKLRSAFLKHEAGEDALVQEAFMDDIGGQAE
jgi:hypothetical protein